MPATTTSLNEALGKVRIAAKRDPRTSVKKGTAPLTVTQANEKAKADANKRRLDLRRNIHPSVSNIEDAIKEAVSATQGMVNADAQMQTSAMCALADAYYDVAAFMLHDGNIKNVPVLMPDKNVAKQLVRFVRSREEFTKGSPFQVKTENNLITLIGSNKLADQVPMYRHVQAAQRALLRAWPTAGVFHGYSIGEPARNLAPNVTWNRAAPSKGKTVRAYCFERKQLFPVLFDRDPTHEGDTPKYVITGEAKSTELRFLDDVRCNTLFAIKFGNAVAAPNLESEAGKIPTGELVIPKATRQPAAGTGASTVKTTGYPIRDQLLALGLLARDGDMKAWGELVEPDTQAALFAASCALIGRLQATGKLIAKSFCDRANPGFDLVALRNAVCSAISDETHGKHYVLAGDGSHGRVIGERGTGILPPVKPAIVKPAKAA